MISIPNHHFKGKIDYTDRCVVATVVFLFWKPSIQSDHICVTSIVDRATVSVNVLRSLTIRVAINLALTNKRTKQFLKCKIEYLFQNEVLTKLTNNVQLTL